MRTLLATCMNWKLVVAVGLATIGFVVVAREEAWAALPLLVVAICPLSMLLMMLMMRPDGPREPDSPAASPESAQLKPGVVPVEASL